MIETHTFEVTSGAALTIQPRNFQGQRFTDGHRNVQVTCHNLAGGSFDVSYRSPESANYIEHIKGAVEVDAVMIAGPRAPIFDAVKVEFSNIPQGTVTKVTINTWPRGL